MAPEGNWPFAAVIILSLTEYGADRAIGRIGLQNVWTVGIRIHQQRSRAQPFFQLFEC
jgi:hypothetical protein